jgi:hypothetical protein
MRKSLFAMAFTLLLLMTMRVWAHHSFASEYDEHKRVTVSGTVREFKWTNPHAWLYVDGKNENGKVTRWRFEMGSPIGLLARCWTKKDLKVGDQVTVEGYGAKDGSHVANATYIALPDGRKQFGGFQETPGAPPKLCNK